MLPLAEDRRAHDRLALSRRCKVYEPRSRRYVGGTTCNVAAGGLLVRLDRPLAVESGDRLRVGIDAPRHAIIRSESMSDAEVVRSATAAGGATMLAIRFDRAPEELPLPIRLAA